MKQLITTTLATTAFILLSGCATDAPTAPSQNSDLNKISNSGGNTKSGLMQKTFESWLKDEWTPTVSKDTNIQKKYLKKEATQSIDKSGDSEVKYVEDEERNFTLQEYVDKASAYIKAHPSDEEDSNIKKMESMPVIGQ